MAQFPEPLRMTALLGFELAQVRCEVFTDAVRQPIERGQHVGRQQFLEEHRLLVQIERVELRVAELVAGVQNAP